MALKKFNADEFHDDALDLMRVNPEKAAASVTQLAKRSANVQRRMSRQINQASDATKDLIALLGSSVAMVGVGFWDARLQAKRAALIADWQTRGAALAGADVATSPEPWAHDGGVSDPDKLWMFPKLLVVPLASGLLAVLAATMRPAGRRDEQTALEKTLTTTATTSLGYVIASAVRNFAYAGAFQRELNNPTLSSVREAA